MKLKKRLTHQISTLTAALLIAFTGASYAATDTNEVWLSARMYGVGWGTNSGNGSITNPFCGDFDYTLNSLPAGCTIHLLPGEFYTKGYGTSGTVLDSNQKILGAGPDVTVIRRDTNYNGSVNVEGVLLGSTANDGIEIRDLTIDVKSDATGNFNRNGIQLLGSKCKVQNVKVINAYGSAAAFREAFIIMVGRPAAEGGLIQNCEVSSVKGNYCSAIVLQGNGAVIGNRVVLPLVSDVANCSMYAYQGNATSNTIFANNTSYGGGVGFYTDSFSETNLALVNNRFSRVMHGIYFQNFNLDGISLCNNQIDITTDPIVGAGSMGFLGIGLYNQATDNSRIFRNVNIQGNIIKYYNNGSRTNSTHGIGIFSNKDNISNIQNVNACGNIVDNLFLNEIESLGLITGQNITTSGRALDTVTNTPYNDHILGAFDRYVYITSTAPTTHVWLNTPPSIPRTAFGREVIIINQKSVTITVHLDNVGNNFSLAAGQNARFLSSASGVWSKL